MNTQLDLKMSMHILGSEVPKGPEKPFQIIERRSTCHSRPAADLKILMHGGVVATSLSKPLLPVAAFREAIWIWRTLRSAWS